MRKRVRACVCIRDGRFHHLLELSHYVSSKWTAMGNDYKASDDFEVVFFA